jgi:hypothetical protein
MRLLLVLKKLERSKMKNYNIFKLDTEVKPNTTYKCEEDIYVTSELSFYKGRTYISDSEGNLSTVHSSDSISRFIKGDFKEK